MVINKRMRVDIMYGCIVGKYRIRDDGSLDLYIRRSGVMVVYNIDLFGSEV